VLALEVGLRLFAGRRNQGGAALAKITEARRRFATDMGLVVPLIRVRDSLDLKPSSYRITLGCRCGTANAAARCWRWTWAMCWGA
jgi:flagellar biosynthesis protein FlhA